MPIRLTESLATLIVEQDYTRYSRAELIKGARYSDTNNSRVSSNFSIMFQVFYNNNNNNNNVYIQQQHVIFSVYVLCSGRICLEKNS